MGYDDAINLASQRLSQLAPEVVCESCAARYENGEYYLKWLNNERALSSAPLTHKILWLHYLTAGGAKKMSGQHIAYREAAPALFYEPNFYKRAVRPLVGCFGKEPEKLIDIVVSLGGQISEHGDASVTINALPYLPLTFILWKGDDEFPSDGNILFDKTAKTWFQPEDLAVLASVAVYDLINISKS